MNVKTNNKTNSSSSSGSSDSSNIEYELVILNICYSSFIIKSRTYLFGYDFTRALKSRGYHIPRPELESLLSAYSIPMKKNKTYYLGDFKKVLGEFDSEELESSDRRVAAKITASLNNVLSMAEYLERKSRA